MMRNVLAVAGTALLATAVSGQGNCLAGSQEVDGNWYCSAVDTIQYKNFAMSGSYNRVTSMDSSTGICTSEPFSFSGSLAPLDGEVSIHLRGPLALKQFAFYTPGSGASKAKRDQGHKHHKNRKHHGHGGHGHLHAHDKEIRDMQNAAGAKRAVGDWVTATIDGQVQSWVNQYAGGPAAAAATPAAASSYVGSSSAHASSQVSDASSAPFEPTYQGDWIQSSYYNAANQVSRGLTFLNNMGGSGSGVFDYKFGNSLSYASSSGTQGAASSQILADTTLPSNTEVILMTDKPCTGDSCGYYRPGTVAMQGFGGAEKIFLAEFSMPDDGTTGWNANMPAYWMLNAQIPRTLQYGQADCSCWTSGCGEFDLLEVLDSGSSYAKSTVHAVTSGGDSDYFDRPTGAPIKVAVVMSNSQATIQILDPDFDFSTTMTNAQVEAIGNHNAGGLIEDLANLGTSLFTLG